jgi:hypothetical protein
MTRALKLAGLGAAGAVVVVAIGLAAAVLWLRTYAPLDGRGAYAPGPGLGAVSAPALGSGGKEVFFPAYQRGRPFFASFTLHNGGRFAVKVEAMEAPGATSAPSVAAGTLLTPDSLSTAGVAGHTHPFRPLTLAPGDSAVLVARFALACPAGGGRVPAVFTDSLRLRYRYLHWFERTQEVRLPFAVTLRCVGGPLAEP